MPGILDTIFAFSFLGNAVRALPARTGRSTGRRTAGPRSASPGLFTKAVKGRISIAAQMARLYAIIEAASDSSIRAVDAHGAAKSHLEVAEFALDRILDEVSGVMDLTQGRNLAMIRDAIVVGDMDFIAA